MGPIMPPNPTRWFPAVSVALAALAVSLASAQQPRQGRKDFALVPAECSDRDRARAQSRFGKMKATEVESKFSQIYSTGHWLKNIAPRRRPSRRGAPEIREWTPGNHSRYYSYADPSAAFKGRFSPSGDRGAHHAPPTLQVADPNLKLPNALPRHSHTTQATAAISARPPRRRSRSWWGPSRSSGCARFWTCRAGI